MYFFFYLKKYFFSDSFMSVLRYTFASDCEDIHADPAGINYPRVRKSPSAGITTLYRSKHFQRRYMHTRPNFPEILIMILYLTNKIK